MIRYSTILLLCFACIGCGESAKEKKEREDYWRLPGTQARFVGTMSDDEVAAIRSELAQISLPAPERLIERMLPPRLESYGRMFADGGLGGRTGPIGGNVSDYWLNSDTVLRIGTLYYSTGEKNYEQTEWFEIMTAKEAYRSDNRGPSGQKWGR